MTNLTLQDRVTRLERQNRGLKALTVVAVAVFAAALCMGQVGVPELVEARNFVVRDGEGNKRAQLGTHGDEVALVLYDRSGEERTIVTLVDGGAHYFCLRDATGVSRMSMDEMGLTLTHKRGMRAELRMGQHHGAPGLSLSDDRSKFCAALYLESEGRPALQLSDEQGHPRVVVGLDEFGAEGLELRYPHQNSPRAQLKVDKDGQPSLVLERPWGESPAVSVHFREDRGAGITVNDSKGRVRTNLGVDRQGRTAFAVMDANGKALFSAP